MKFVANIFLQGRHICRYLHCPSTLRSFTTYSVLRVRKRNIKPERKELLKMDEVVENTVQRSEYLKDCTVCSSLSGERIDKQIETRSVSANIAEGASALIEPATETGSGLVGNAEHEVKARRKRSRGRKSKSDSKSLEEKTVNEDMQNTEQDQPPKCGDDPVPLTSSTPVKPRRKRNRHKNKGKKNESADGDNLVREPSTKMYEEYWNKESIYKALKNKTVVAGVLRISPLNFQNSWVSIPGLKYDIFIKGRLHQNRALSGDIVAVKINNKVEWTVLQDRLDYHENKFLVSSFDESKSLVEDVSKGVEDLTMGEGGLREESELLSENDHSAVNDIGMKDDHEEMQKTHDSGTGGDIDVSEEDSALSISMDEKTKCRKHEDISDDFLQPTGRVIYILEKKHSRVAAGYLKPFSKNPDKNSALFSPTDSRLPRLRIQKEFCPEGFFNRPQDFERTLLIAKITDWKRESVRDSFLAHGYIAKSLGNTGEIEPETEAILLQCGIDTGPFPDKALACLPNKKPWTIPKKEYDSRRDFRKECVFTIDPATARDLDDAVHCSRLADGVFEVGVHIADVSYFVRERTALDEVAFDRATSTYMVQKVIPMLPRLLCEELCSLNPDKDRLTFSVVWKIGPNGEILDEWMGKGIIKSCVKMAYEHAQDIIVHPDKEWKTEELPPISEAFSIPRIVQSVLDLNQIACHLKEKRYNNGALRITLPKLQFTLDQDSGMPNGYHAYEQKESNQLIEEFMLLANMAVAVQIYTGCPEQALLRRHPLPGQRSLDDLEQFCEDLGLEFKTDSSKHIQESLAQFSSTTAENMILSQHAMKAMKNALYFCTGVVKDEEEFLHYALSIPFYTHFTSPIRRYPDIIVHRQLASCLEIDKPSKCDKDTIALIASHCNDKKLAAKTAGEMSNELYFAVFLRESGTLKSDGMVSSLMDHSCDVIIPEFGIVKRCYVNLNDDQVKDVKFSKRGHLSPPQLVITWEIKENEEEKTVLVEQVLSIFTQVRVVLSIAQAKEEKSLKVVAKLLPPKTVNGKIKCE